MLDLLNRKSSDLLSFGAGSLAQRSCHAPTGLALEWRASLAVHFPGQAMIGTVLMALAGEPLTILELMAR
jgi:predicted exporter